MRTLVPQNGTGIISEMGIWPRGQGTAQAFNIISVEKSEKRPFPCYAKSNMLIEAPMGDPAACLVGIT
jgi:hypothetical protein